MCVCRYIVYAQTNYSYDCEETLMSLLRLNYNFSEVGSDSIFGVKFEKSNFENIFFLTLILSYSPPMHLPPEIYYIYY